MLCKCLSVQQPWAWGIVHGLKRVENRTRRTRYRGPLLIHAGKSRIRLGDEGQLLPGLPQYDVLPFGAIVGLVELVDCVRVDELLDESQRPFASGPWCWILADARPLAAPIPWRGRQGLFGVSIDDDVWHTLAARRRLAG